jgi:Protein of unknown function (DUF2510)
MSTITGQIHSRFPEGEVVTSGSPAPGWYPDPLGAPQQRFFDGTHWTDHYAPQIAAHEIAPPLVRPLEPLPDKVATPPAPMWSAASEPVPGPSTSFLPEPADRKRNPLFFVLAVLSGIPTAFFGLVFVFGNQSDLAGIAVIWCFMWTWVWWRLSDRYR